MKHLKRRGYNRASLTGCQGNKDPANLLFLSGEEVPTEGREDIGTFLLIGPGPACHDGEQGIEVQPCLRPMFSQNSGKNEQAVVVSSLRLEPELVENGIDDGLPVRLSRQSEPGRRERITEGFLQQLLCLLAEALAGLGFLPLVREEGFPETLTSEEQKILPAFSGRNQSDMNREKFYLRSFGAWLPIADEFRSAVARQQEEKPSVAGDQGTCQSY